MSINIGRETRNQKGSKQASNHKRPGNKSGKAASAAKPTNLHKGGRGTATAPVKAAPKEQGTRASRKSWAIAEGLSDAEAKFQAILDHEEEMEKQQREELKREVAAESKILVVQPPDPDGSFEDIPVVWKDDEDPPVIVKDRDITVFPWLLNGQHKVDGNGLVNVIDWDGRWRKCHVAREDDEFKLHPQDRRFAIVLKHGTGPALTHWGSNKHIAQAALTVRHLAIGAKTDLELRALLPQALNSLEKLIPVWKGADNQMLEYLVSPEFTASVVKYHKARLSVAKDVALSRAYVLAASVGATAVEAEQALWRYEQFQNDKYGLEKIPYAALSASMFALAGAQAAKESPWAALCSTVVGVWAGVGAWKRALTPGARRVYEALTAQVHRVSYGAVMVIPQTCSLEAGLPWPTAMRAWKWNQKVTPIVFKAGKQHEPCKPKPPIESYGTWIDGVPAVLPKGCHHDAAASLAIRYLYERSYSEVEVAKVIHFAKEWCLKTFKGKEHLWQDTSEDEWLQRLPGPRASKIRSAFPHRASFKKYLPTKLFVKLELYLGKTPTTWKPRPIQGRELEFQRLIGPYFHSMSNWFGSVLHKFSRNIYDKNLTATELGQKAREYFGKGRVFEADVSNFDGSLHPAWREFERWFIENICPQLPPWWDLLRKEWTTNRISGKHGVKAKTTHGRSSGDCWTSLFNSLINIIIVQYATKDTADVVAKGDDNFFTTAMDLNVEKVVGLYQSIGMKVKLKEVTDIWSLGYCSGYFWPTTDGPKWGVAPLRTIAKLGVNLHRHPKNVLPQLLYGTAVSMLPIAGHVPLIGGLLRSIVTASQNAGLAPKLPIEEFWKTSDIEVHDCESFAWDILARRCGLSAQELALMERQTNTHVSGRALETTDFPIVFGNECWLNAFMAEQDVPDEYRLQGLRHEPTQIVPQSTKQDWALFHILVAPLWEEAARFLFPPTTVVLALAEGRSMPLNVFLHAGLGVVSITLGMGAAIGAHLAWNVACLYEAKRQGTFPFDYGAQPWWWIPTVSHA